MQSWLTIPGFSENPDLAIEYLRRRGLDSAGLYWITCTWCLSIPAGLLPAAVWVWWRDLPAAQFAVLVLALSLLSVVVLDLQKITYGKRVMYTPTVQTDEAEQRS